ncbi:MAG TPA: hypothetical protein VHM91_03455, partial [Verrucomicrobiales bacterium]|nr:hypothetical protein [Verrucomicrobiales bacterium]
MIRSLFRCACAALLLAASARTAGAYVLRLDFEDDDDVNSTLQTGWTAVTASGGANLNGSGIGLTIAAAGSSVTIDDRVRVAPNGNGGGAEADMWEDFIFANGSDVATDGMDLVFTGLQPGRDYPVKLWMFDKGSPNIRTSTWNGQSYSFNGSDAVPAALTDKVLLLTVTSSPAGTLTLQGRASATGQPHNVFLNGLEIGDPPGAGTAPTDITLAPAAIGATASVGAVVGVLSSTDPEAGDNHTYTLVAGTGSTHNGLFSLGGIDGEEVRLAGSLAGLAGQVLSIRVRTVDQHGDWYE